MNSLSIYTNPHGEEAWWLIAAAGHYVIDCTPNGKDRMYGPLPNSRTVMLRLEVILGPDYRATIRTIRPGMSLGGD